MSTATLSVGQWSAFRSEITPEEKDIFKAVLGKLEGATYTPLAVSTQVVAGNNYCFLASVKSVYPGATTDEVVLVFIYKPLGGFSHLIEIKKLKLD